MAIGTGNLFYLGKTFSQKVTLQGTQHSTIKKQNIHVETHTLLYLYMDSINYKPSPSLKKGISYNYSP